MIHAVRNTVGGQVVEQTNFNLQFVSRRQIVQVYELRAVNFSASSTATFDFFSLPKPGKLQQTLLKRFFFAPQKPSKHCNLLHFTTH